MMSQTTVEMIYVLSWLFVSGVVVRTGIYLNPFPENTGWQDKFTVVGFSVLLWPLLILCFFIPLTVAKILEKCFGRKSK